MPRIDADVIKIFRSSGIADEALGNVWQEASQAILLETGQDHSNETEMDNTIDWKDFLVLLDICYRMSGNGLESFLMRFPLPLARTISIRGKRNPFHTKPATESANSKPSPSIARKAVPSSPTGSTHFKSKIRSMPASTGSSPGATSEVGFSLPTSPKQRFDSLKHGGVSGAWYLENLQEDSHAEGLKEFYAVLDSSTMSGLETANVPSLPEVYKTGMIPNLSSGAGIEVVGAQPQVIIPRQLRIGSDELPDRSGLAAPEPTSTLVESQSQENRTSSSARRRSSRVEAANEPASGSASPINQRPVNPPLPGTFEMEVPHCTPETEQIAKNRLIGIEGSGSSRLGDILRSSSKSLLSPAPSGDNQRSSLKSLFLKSKKNQRVGQFSLSTLATGLEMAAREGSLPLIEAFFKFGADPNYSVKGSKPIRHRALNFAAKGGQSHVIDYMILHGADSDPDTLGTALVHAVLAGRVEVATRLIVVHNANVDSGVFLQHDNPEYSSSSQDSALYSHIEYVNVLSAASKILNRDERVRFIQLLVRKNCNLNAYSWKAYKFYELKRRQDTYPSRVLVQELFGYSPLARFTPICPASVRLLLQGMHLF